MLHEIFARIAIFLGVVEKVDYGIMGCYLLSKDIEIGDNQTFYIIKGFAVSCYRKFPISDSSVSILLSNTEEIVIENMDSVLLYLYLEKLFAIEKKLKSVQDILPYLKEPLDKTSIEKSKLFEQTNVLLSQLQNKAEIVEEFSIEETEWLNNYFYDGLQFNMKYFSFDDFPASLIRKLNSDKSGNLLVQLFYNIFIPVLYNNHNKGKHIENYISSNTMQILVNISFDQLSISELEKSTGVPLHNFKKHFNNILSYLFSAISNNEPLEEIENEIQKMYEMRAMAFNDNPRLFN